MCFRKYCVALTRGKTLGRAICPYYASRVYKTFCPAKCGSHFPFATGALSGGLVLASAAERMPTTSPRCWRGVRAWRGFLLSKGNVVSFSRLLNGHASAHYICGMRRFAARRVPARGARLDHRISAWPCTAATTARGGQAGNAGRRRMGRTAGQQELCACKIDGGRSMIAFRYSSLLANGHGAVSPVVNRPMRRLGWRHFRTLKEFCNGKPSRW
jgi:hypothetical protein